MVKSACSAIWRVPCISECQGRNPAHLRGSSIGQELVQVLVWYTLNQPTINQLAGAARTGNLWSHSLLQPCGAAAPAICHQQRHHHHLHLRYRCCPALQGVYRPSQGCNLTCRAGPATPSAEASAGKGQAQQQGFTLEEVEQHNTEQDCWIIIKQRVYDVSGWADRHPGGRVILSYAGRDATDVFSGFHAASTWRELKHFHVGHLTSRLRLGLCIGPAVVLRHAATDIYSICSILVQRPPARVLKPSPGTLQVDVLMVPVLQEDVPVAPLLADFRALRARMQQQGLFCSNKAYYAFKLATNLSILAGAMLTLALGANSWWLLLTSAFLLGLFWQQTGWLAHDFLHHQVFRSRGWNNFVGLLLGNISQGFSIGWWKTKHNTHHAAPNALESGSKAAVDPDIDTLPLLAWSTEMLDSLPSTASRTMIRCQQYLFFPVLLVARMSWCQQSIGHALGMVQTAPEGWTEVGGLTAHYAWYLGAAFSLLPITRALLYLVASQAFCGFLLSIVFVQSHNGMEVYSTDKDFVTAQIVSTRDISSGLFEDWFTGGLNYQIEHHLFPSLPRHNLGRVQKDVQALCEKHALLYESCSIAEGTRRVLKRLAEVAEQA